MNLTRRRLIPVRAALLLLLVASCGPSRALPCARAGLARTAGPLVNLPMFHGDRSRLGWSSAERTLAPAAVGGGGFGALWSSPPLDALDIDGVSYPPHLYASPIYADDLELTGGGDFDGRRLGVVFAATSNGFAYAVNGFDDETGAACIPAGTILWRTQLGQAAVVKALDGGVPMGVLSTPALDLDSSPPRLYVAAMDADAGWQAWALDASNGRVLDGWPVTMSDAVVSPVNGNGPAMFEDAARMSQRGALNLSPAGDLLYVPFGGYSDTGTGWLVAIDTAAAEVRAAFSGAPMSDRAPNGGMWGPGGVVVEPDGTVYMTTGNSPEASESIPGVWGESLLRWSPTLALTGTYTPWNYCNLEHADADLGGSSPALLPDLDPTSTSTPHLIAFGGKQGNVYLVDRDQMAGDLTSRPPCGADPTADGSLLPPDPQPELGGARGPLNVFGPYSEVYGNGDRAKMRTTPAYFEASDGGHYLFVSGASKTAPDSTTSAPPSLARLRVVTAAGAPAYLRVDALAQTLTFLNPGAPVVTSGGGTGAVVWILDENAGRGASLIDPSVPRPILYAVDGSSLATLWSTGAGELEVGGKYSTPLVVHGTVFVGTDRIRAFGLGP
jgi:hypothetical protein